ncbi:hypothetical protein, partial [Bifidobacterium bifidum]|uniref:hypothetical protein n=1 Tax=Bifidobacterium bifidum TaxID=1681 RepID=UPI0020B3051A
ERRPVTAEVTGSSPAGVATKLPMHVGSFCFLPFFDAIRKDGDSECSRFDTPSAPMPALGGARLQRVKCMRKRIGGMFATHGEPRKIRGGRSWRLATIFAVSHVTKVFKE